MRLFEAHYAISQREFLCIFHGGLVAVSTAASPLELSVGTPDSEYPATVWLAWRRALYWCVSRCTAK